ncbi:hypothetical protein ACELLULO517_01585 [Acidisoma cellulosilytica]|uniref:Uncharacterized protein n=1 Tax=Acidisoma cellulosilyticum TaxID=2802395 RepID=A0A963YXD6_9PROT|nr:hypothetical protein [Acidisoma cellulosilyticum]MCB8878908.1 hypothetical protein [Acidisoma cellulosilyticum]
MVALKRPLGKTARNEKLKLAASFFNSLAVSAVVAAFVVPGVAITEHAPPYHVSWSLIFVVGCWCVVGIFAHLVAQAILEKLVD